MQRVHNVREHLKLFIAQELQIIQKWSTCYFEEKLWSVYVPPVRINLSSTECQRQLQSWRLQVPISLSVY
jgi:hypothetical protein